MRAVSSGTGGTGCGRRSDMGDLWTRKSSNAMAPHKAADFANGVRSFSDRHSRVVSFPVRLQPSLRFNPNAAPSGTDADAVQGLECPLTTFRPLPLPPALAESPNCFQELQVVLA